MPAGFLAVAFGVLVTMGVYQTWPANGCVQTLGISARGCSMAESGSLEKQVIT